MLTLITGTPGAGKTLYGVWELLRSVPGSTIEAQAPLESHGVKYQKGDAVPRHLFCNINSLLIEHTRIEAADLERWPEWAQAGDVILYDEVQEVWRTRGMSSKVPEAIQALETHRHKGVDIILITQHPGLVDPNVRKLVNRHFHLRRITSFASYLYEWDHCSDPGRVKSALQGKMWFYPGNKGFALYKSASLHTKPVARLPRVAIAGVLAIAGLAYLAPTAYSRITDRLSGKSSVQVAAERSGTAPAKPVASAPGASQAVPSAGPASVPEPGPGQVQGPPAPMAMAKAGELAGCAKLGARCSCFDGAGKVFEVEPGACEGDLPKGQVLDLATVPQLREEYSTVPVDRRDQVEDLGPSGRDLVRRNEGPALVRITGKSIYAW